MGNVKVNEFTEFSSNSKPSSENAKLGGLLKPVQCASRAIQPYCVAILTWQRWSE